MRFDVAKTNRAARRALRFFAAAASIGTVLACTPAPVNAVGTTVEVPVCDTAPSTIDITTPQDNSVFSQSPVTITGTVYRLTQIQVYVNGNYASTVPLDSGATTFTTNVYLDKGSNLVRLVGVDFCTQDSPEVTWKLIYAPGATPTPQPGPPGTPPKTVQDAQQALIDSSEYLQDQVDQASLTKPARSVSGMLYDMMVILDIVPRNATVEQANRMLLRMALIVAGTSLVVSGDWFVTVYHGLRYQILRWNHHALPKLVTHHATLALRLVGVALIIIPFVFIA